MKKKHQSILLLCLIAINYKSNAQATDSIKNNIEEITIVSFQKSIPILENTSSVAKINQNLLLNNHPERLLEAFNLIPGTKLEERSPGSYRLSMRGSTIRSPFGVRNVKIYLNDFILTDPSGNAYLNIIEPSFINSIEIMKGAQGGEMGSESGGVAVLNTFTKDQLSLDLSAGSYGLFSEKLKFSKKLGKHNLQIGQAHYQSDSYREQSAIKKNAFFVNDVWSYNDINALKLILMYTDLHYETPGGLTLAQMEQNPRSARLATNTLPSAVTQQAGIYNKTFLGGIAHDWQINEKWSQFTLIQTTHTKFENPFISNYEFRNEKNVQGRAYLNYKKAWENISIQSRLGLEMGQQSLDIKNYDNNAGVASNPQKFDDIKTNSAFYYFTQNIIIKNRWYIDASLSVNTIKYNWETLFPTTDNGKINFDAQWLPQLGVTFMINKDLSVRAKISKGTSSPTTEEVRSSNQTIQTHLNPEYGWNKEVGIRKRFGSLYAEITAFDYNLENAIVRRQDAGGNDYFINAGGTKQKGLEISIESNEYKLSNKIIDRFNFLISGIMYDFKYKDYQIANNNFTNNQLPGVSKFGVQSTIGIGILELFKLNINHYYQSKIYLNDANTFNEKGFVIGNINLNTNIPFGKQYFMPYLGIHNIYSTKYSAGYDLNAFGNRFYNPAASINFYTGVQFQF